MNYPNFDDMPATIGDSTTVEFARYCVSYHIDLARSIWRKHHNARWWHTRRLRAKWQERVDYHRVMTRLFAGLVWELERKEDA